MTVHRPFPDDWQECPPGGDTENRGYGSVATDALIRLARGLAFLFAMFGGVLFVIWLICMFPVVFGVGFVLFIVLMAAWEWGGELGNTLTNAPSGAYNSGVTGGVMAPLNKVTLDLTDDEFAELRIAARYALADAENASDGNPDQEAEVSALKKLVVALGG